MANTDRRVHGRDKDGYAVVRYNLASRWYLEKGDHRVEITVGEAARAALSGKVFPGVVGGSRFDYLVKKERGE